MWNAVRGFAAAVDWTVSAGLPWRRPHPLLPGPPRQPLTPPRPALRTLQERWLISLVWVEATMLLAVLIFRRKIWVQTGTFFTCSEPSCSWQFLAPPAGPPFPSLHLRPRPPAVSVIYNAERLNRIAARHWRSFARQPYFDDAGVFASAVLSAPMMLIMFLVLCNYLITSSQLLVEMKRKELQYKARQYKARKAAGAKAEGAARPARGAAGSSKKAQ
jgi:hypothetical protein